MKIVFCPLTKRLPLWKQKHVQHVRCPRISKEKTGLLRLNLIHLIISHRQRSICSTSPQGQIKKHASPAIILLAELIFFTFLGIDFRPLLFPPLPPHRSLESFISSSFFPSTLKNGKVASAVSVSPHVVYFVETFKRLFIVSWGEVCQPFPQHQNAAYDDSSR